MKNTLKDPVYKPEAMELLDRLKAKGVILIVSHGNRNVDDVEVTVAMTHADFQFAAKAMIMTGLKMLNETDLNRFITEIRR